MRLSLLVAPTQGVESLLSTAATLDEVTGTLYLPDHITGGTHFQGRTWMDPWVALGVVAARTTQLYVGTLVSSMVLRPAPALALQTSTLMGIAPDRVLLGVGVGAQSDAHRIGSTWPPTADRVERFGMWVHALAAELTIRNVSPPLCIAAGTVATLPTVARYADAWVTAGGYLVTGLEKRLAVRQLATELDRLCALEHRKVKDRLVLIDPHEASPWQSRSSLEDCIALWAEEGMTEAVVFLPSEYEGSTLVLEDCLDLFAGNVAV